MSSQDCHLYEKVYESEENLSISELTLPKKRKSTVQRLYSYIDKATSNDENIRTIRKQLIKSITISIVIKSLVVILAVLGLVSMFMQGHRYYQEHRTINCGCGSSVEEAKEMGCKFEAIAASWLPDECRDDELGAEFNRAGPGPNGQWPYYADRAMTKLLTLEGFADLAGTNRSFFTTWDWHVAHCFWRWKKQIRWHDRMANLDVLGALGHIDHCEEIIYADRNVVVASGVAVNGSTFS